MSANIINKIDDLLKTDKNFDTRAGLRFMMEVIRDAFEYIEEKKTADQTTNTTLQLFERRIIGVEGTLKEFLERRETEQKKAEEERTFYRRAVLGGLLSLILSQLAQWIFG